MGAPNKRPFQNKPLSVLTSSSFNEQEMTPAWVKATQPVIRSLSKLDRGDFRWEFLVPWLPEDKTLTRLEKFIVCFSFIGLALILQEILDPEASVTDHLSYIAFFFSYAIGNPIGFRVIAIAASILEISANLIMFDGAITKADGIPVLYNLLFIVINSYYVLRYQLNQLPVSFEPVENELFALCFEPLGVKRNQFRQLLEFAEFKTADTEEVLCVQDEPLYDIFVAINGTLDVIVGEQVVATIPPLQIIGEVSLMENLQSPGGTFHQVARATIVAEPGAQYVKWTQESFYKLTQKDREFAYSCQLMISRTLSRKLANARSSTAELVKSASESKAIDEELMS